MIATWLVNAMMSINVGSTGFIDCSVCLEISSPKSHKASPIWQYEQLYNLPTISQLIIFRHLR